MIERKKKKQEGMEYDDTGWKGIVSNRKERNTKKREGKEYEETGRKEYEETGRKGIRRNRRRMKGRNSTVSAGKEEAGRKVQRSGKRVSHEDFERHVMD